MIVVTHDTDFVEPWHTVAALYLEDDSTPELKEQVQVAMVQARGQNRVTWRGVEYEVRGRQHVRLLEYRPFSAKSDQSLSESVM